MKLNKAVGLDLSYDQTNRKKKKEKKGVKKPCKVQQRTDK